MASQGSPADKDNNSQGWKRWKGYEEYLNYETTRKNNFLF